MKQFILFILLITVFLFGFYSSQPPTGYTGSPHANTVGTCTECHGGGTFQGTISLNHPLLMANQAHDMEVEVCYNPAGGTPVLAGFSLDIVNFMTGQHYGLLSPGSNTAVQDGGEYVSHDGALAFPIGEQCVTYEFVWTTPPGFDISDPVGFFAASVLANDNGSTSGDRVLINDFVPLLPVELISFEARKLASGQAEITWEWAELINVRKFVLERSIAGSEFVSISEFMVTEDKSSHGNHTFVDSLFQSKSVFYYYRLRTENLDDAHNYSKIISLQSKPFDDVDIFVYPNPLSSKDQVHIDLGSSPNNGRWTYEIYNLNGIRLSNGDLLGKELNSLKHALPPGQYVLQIFSDGNVIFNKNLLVINR